MTRRTHRLPHLLVAALLAVLPVPFAAPAAAHTGLVGSVPAAGSAVAGPPAALRLTFAADLLAGGTQVTLRGPDGAALLGEPAVLGAEVSVPVTGRLRAGRYVVVYRAVAVDGHPETGTVRFRVVAARAAGSGAGPGAPAGATGSAVTSPAAAPGPDLPLSWLLLGVSVTGIVGSAARRRSRGPEDADARR